MNLLDLVPALRRHLSTYVDKDHVDSDLAGYLSDSIESLSFFWTRDYAITFTSPKTYEVDPLIVAKDKRPIILMASIIYKMGNTQLASFTDGDFSFQLQRGGDNFISLDVDELDKYISRGIQLAKPSTAPLRGFDNIYNLESYSWARIVAVL